MINYSSQGRLDLKYRVSYVAYTHTMNNKHDGADCPNRAIINVC